MSSAPNQVFDDACYRALAARDARFDGNFFTGVTSTGIYCRPVCRVRTPKRENCRFFEQAAQAEQAGFRPCLRCRPELAPARSVIGNAGNTMPWSMQDASRILAHQAARLMQASPPAEASATGVGAVAQRLGISERHLRRIFQAQFGVSPLRYLQTRRLLCAKQLLTDTPLSVARVAQLSGFTSVRRFNAVFVSHYQLQPTQLRQTRQRLAQGSPQTGIQVFLSYRPPYDVDAILQFFAVRALHGTEVVTRSPHCKSYASTLRLQHGDQVCSGWLVARFDEPRCRVRLTVSDALGDVLPTVMARVRSLLDLDADPQAINRVLHASFPNCDGWRLPGALCGFELSVRAVLGQQISVTAARTVSLRLLDKLGEPVDTPIAGLDRLFPSPQVLAAVSGDTLGQLGIVKQRQNAILALAQSVSRGTLQLHAGADLASTLASLLALPGIGDWTTQYIAMRALAWPDAFPGGDVALHNALALRDHPHPAQAALTTSEAWRPWRSYAVIRAWASLPTPAAAPMPSR